MKILIVTYYNFESKPYGATNRALELAKVLSHHTKVEIIHQGPNMAMEDIRFIGYKSKPLFATSEGVSNAVSPYISYAFPDFYRVLKRVVSDVDVIQVEEPSLFAPTLMVRKTLNKNSLMVLDAHNADFMAKKSKINRISINSLLTTLTIPYVFLSENFAVKNAKSILSVSHEDREILMKFYGIPASRITIIPNGVNVSKFEKTPPANDPILQNPNTVFFHGALSWYPNAEAANIIVDCLAPKIPEAVFLIAGGNPPASLIKKLGKVKNVKYLGFLENLEGWIKSSKVCIAPILRGGGTKLKVLEYAAAGKPMVGTFKAVEGLGMVNAVHGLFFQHANEDFINGIRRLLSDGQLAKELGQNAKELARNYDWPLIGEKLYKTYLDFMSYA